MIFLSETQSGNAVITPSQTDVCYIEAFDYHQNPQGFRLAKQIFDMVGVGYEVIEYTPEGHNNE